MSNSVLKSVQQTISEYKMIMRGERVVCAVSGGADSVAMLRALFLLRDGLQIDIACAHLNHGLRGAESDRDAKFVKMLCTQMNIEFYEEKIKMEHGAGLEERARDERYAFYRRALKELNAQKLATAHHAEDNLETILFHLSRGCGLRGLCGIPPVRGEIIRPMLFCEKKQILDFLNAEGISWVEDSSNATDDFARNVIRHKVLPVLKQVNPDVVKNSARCVQIISSDEKTLAKEAQEWLAQHEGEDWLPTLAGELSDAHLARVVRLKCKKTFKNTNRDLDFSRTCDIINLIRQSKPVGSVILFNSCEVRRAGDKIYFIEKRDKIEEIILNSGESISISGYLITCTGEPVVIRARRDGDRVRLSGRRTRLIKKILCDAKIPQHLRDTVPIIEKNGEIIAVCGFGFAEGYDNGGVTIERDA